MNQDASNTKIYHIMYVSRVESTFTASHAITVTSGFCGVRVVQSLVGFVLLDL